VTVRAGEEKDRDGDCDDNNQQRIDTALYGGSVGVDFGGHEIVFWGSGEGLKKSDKLAR
jgi:hypothetical protein